MNEKGIALPVWVAALLAAVTLLGGTLPSWTGATAGASQAESKSVATVAEVQPAKPPRTGWREPVRLYREFLGLEPLPETDAKPAASQVDPDWGRSVAEVKREAAARGCTLQSVVALVPDPVDSELPADFDKAIDAIQKGFAHAGYLADRIWIPWSSEASGASSEDAKKVYRRSPGLLLFRRFHPATANAPLREELMAVFLIGETPKVGVQKEALYQALDLAATLHSSEGAEPFRILGPFFSGTAESLRLALLHWSADKGSRPPAFDIVSGSATGGAESLENVLISEAPETGAATSPAPPTMRFFRASVPEEVQQDALDGFFKQMGWGRRSIALIVESDTAYGKSGAEMTMAVVDRGFTFIQIPSHISAIRTARELSSSGKTSEPPGSATAAPKTQLGLSLADQGHPIDLVPEFSPLSAPVNELAMMNLLETIAREGFRYVGILATDPKDKLFLAERIRRFAPDVVRFTFEGDLLFAHPQEQQAMNGMLVLSGFPLFAESGSMARGSRSTPESGSRSKNRLTSRRQFTSEFHHGIFNAVRVLVEGYPRSLQTTDRADVWISAVGNGTLWPISSVRTDVSASMNLLAPPPGDRTGVQELSTKADLQLLLIVAILCGLGWWLRKTAIFPELPHDPGGHQGAERSRRRLLALGLAVLSVGAAALLLLGLLPDWWSSSYLPSRWIPEGRSLSSFHATRPHVFSMTGLAVAYLYLLLSLVSPADAPPVDPAEPPTVDGTSGTERRRMTDRWSWLPPGPRSIAGWSGLVAGLVFLPLLGLGLVFWVPGEIEFFYLRTRSFGSGLSVAVSFFWLVLAFYLWILCELRRRRLTAWQEIDWPEGTLCEPAFEGANGIVDKLRGVVGRTVPEAPGFWIAVLVILATPFLFLWWSFRPLAETQAFGHVLLPLLFLAFLLSVVSFYRFFRIWRKLRKLLVRIEYTPLAARLQSLSGEVGWDPMKSFSWQIPPFKSLTLSAARLRAVAQHGSYRSRLEAAEVDLNALDSLLSGVFASDASDVPHKLGVEIGRRRKLGAIFQAACRALRAERGQAEVADFFAVRVIVYLRYLFAHLRNCLIGAMCAGLFLVFAVTSYSFVPKSFVSVLVWAALGIGVAMTFWTFVEMDRNVALSLIGGSSPGKVTFNRTFVSNLFTYALIPLLGLLATQVPSAGQLLGFFKPLLRILGAG